MRIKVSFEVEVPSTGHKVTEENVEQWVGYSLGALGGMSGDNPLCMTDIDDAENIIIDEI